MEVSYKFTPKEIQKLSKFKNPSIILRKENIVKNGKYKIHLTKNMFNKLLEEKQLKYVFTDKRKENYIRKGGSLASIFKSLSPHLIKFGKKLLPALGITTASTLTSHGISKENKNKFDNFIMNTFSTFSNNISNINNSQNSRLSDSESKNLSDTQITKINELENIDLEKINKYSYYIKEFFMHNIDLVRRFNITSEVDFIQVLQFEIDRNFLVNDIIKFFISIKFLYENMKMYWVLYFKIDIHYKDDVLIKSFKKQMTSKGFIFKNLVTFNIDNMFKLNKQTD